jgi:hypothetical protein
MMNPAKIAVHKIQGAAATVCQTLLKGLAISLLAGGFVTGCATAPANGKWFAENGRNAALGEVMKRQDKIIRLSPPEAAGDKPVLLLLHGATDDPTEMMDIVREWSGKYDVFLYAFNFHRPVEQVAADFDGEMKRIESENRRCRRATVVDYSYSAIVFREAVILADAPSLFSGVSLIQLVPTAGGSNLARDMRSPFTAWLVSLFSQFSRAENPYGRFAEQLWAGAGNQKFNAVIRPERVHTILLEDDEHSLAQAADKLVRQRYENGIGTNILMIPKTAGVSHGYFPTNPVALGYLRQLLEPPPPLAARN